VAIEGLARLGESMPGLRRVGCAIRMAGRSSGSARDPFFGGQQTFATLIALANHPDWRFADAARIRLNESVPTDPRERRRRELATEHTYVRAQIIEALAADGSALALDDLEVATQNLDAHTRALALQRLATRSPERARRISNATSPILISGCGCMPPPSRRGAPMPHRRSS